RRLVTELPPSSVSSSFHRSNSHASLMGGSGTIILLFLMNAIFRGAGDTTTPTLVNLFCYWLWEIPLAYSLAIRYPRGPDGQFNRGGLPAHPERDRCRGEQQCGEEVSARLSGDGQEWRGRVNTVFPGWYSGRAVHIHSKVRFFSGKNETYEFTSQFFFDDALTDTIFTKAPYSARASAAQTVDG